MSELANGYERCAAEFLALRGTSVDRGMGLAQVRDWAWRLPPGATVLELGAGSGLPLTRALVEAGHAVYAVDASPTLVAAFRRNHPGAPVACEPAEESTYFGRRFQAVLAWGLVFLLPAEAQERLLRGMAGALEPGGQLLFTAPAEPCAWPDAITGQESRSLGAARYRALLLELGVTVGREYEDEGQNHYYEAVRAATGAADSG